MPPTIESVRKHYRETILEGMARTLWLLAYADWAEELSEEDREQAGIQVARNGQDWDNIAPETPKAATKAADALAELWESSEGDLVELYSLAQEADLGEPFSFDEEYSAEKDSARQRLERQWKMADAELFGSMLAHMGVGTGVSWFDDHKRFDLQRPSFECYFDGEDLNWSGSAKSGHMFGHKDVRELGKIGRITIVNPGDASWTKHSYVLAFGHGMAVSDTLLMAYANGVDSALDECIDWLVDNEPGHIVDDQVEEEYHRARQEGLSEEAAQERAEMDTTSGGNAGNHIASDQWTIVAEDPTEEQLQELAGRKNPAGLSAKGERMYEDIKRSYQRRHDPRAKEIASRTVLARSHEDPSLVRHHRNPPPNLTTSGERLYEEVKSEYEAKGDPRAKEIAARTVYARAKEMPGLLKVGLGRPPGVPNPKRHRT